MPVVLLQYGIQVLRVPKLSIHVYCPSCAQNGRLAVHHALQLSHHSGGWNRSFCHSLVSPQSLEAGFGFQLAPKYVGAVQVIHLAMKLICMVKDDFKGVS